MKKIRLIERQVEGKTFFLWKVGVEGHGRPSFCIWVNPKLIEREGDECFISLPLARVDLRKGKRDFILSPGARNLFDVFIKCGYRGDSHVTILSPGEVYYYLVFSSPRGNLGISQGALVLTDENAVRFSWTRSGRLYGNPSEGISIIRLDGTEEQIEEDALSSLD